MPPFTNGETEAQLGGKGEDQCPPACRLSGLSRRRWRARLGLASPSEGHAGPKVELGLGPLPPGPGGPLGCGQCQGGAKPRGGPSRSLRAPHSLTPRWEGWPWASAGAGGPSVPIQDLSASPVTRGLLPACPAHCLAHCLPGASLGGPSRLIHLSEGGGGERKGQRGQTQREVRGASVSGPAVQTRKLRPQAREAGPRPPGAPG